MISNTCATDRFFAEIAYRSFHDGSVAIDGITTMRVQGSGFRVRDTARSHIVFMFETKNGEAVDLVEASYPR